MVDPHSDEPAYLNGWRAGRLSGLTEAHAVSAIVGAIFGATLMAILLGAIFWGGIR